MSLGRWAPRPIPFGTLSTQEGATGASALEKGDHGPLPCAAMRADMKEHANMVSKWLDAIDACDEGPSPCTPEQLGVLFGELVSELEDLADVKKEYDSRCVGRDLIV